MDFLEDIINNITDAICIIDCTSNKIKFVNDAFSDQLVSRELIINQSFETNILQSDFSEHFFEKIQESKLSSNEVTIGICKSLSSVGKEKFPVYKDYVWIAKKINAECVMIRGSLDIAKYSLPQNENMNFSEELLDFFQNAPIALHWLTASGHILWANNTELECLGYTKEEYIGHHISEFLVNEDDALTKTFADLSAGKTVHNAPFKFLTKSGKIVYVASTINVRRNPDGSIHHTRCFIQDDTDRRISEEVKAKELENMKTLSKSKDKFIRRAFHDIKTPLHIISTCISEIEECIRANITPKISDVTLMRQNIDIILSTAQDVNYSIKFGDGRTISINPVSIDLELSLRDIFTHAEAIEKLSSQNITYTYSLNSCPKLVLMDTSIFRVFLHLFRNAIRFSPDNAKIELEINMVHSNEYEPLLKKIKANNSSNCNNSEQHQQKTTSNLYSFKIINNTKQPIDFDLIHHSFHHSYTAMKSFHDDESVNGLTSDKGLGLGLYVSYNIIQAMGGTLQCSSENDNICFRLLPAEQSSSILNRVDSFISKNTDKWTDVYKSQAAKVHVFMDTISKATGNSSNTSNHMIAVLRGNASRILVVDDSQMCQRVLVRLLEKHHYHVDTADNGAEAVKMLSFEPCLYDACLMDLRMPIMDGITATKVIREKCHLQNLPVIVVTAELGEDIQNEAISAGANSVISKPAGSSEILDAIRRFNEMEI